MPAGHLISEGNQGGMYNKDPWFPPRAIDTMYPSHDIAFWCPRNIAQTHQNSVGQITDGDFTARLSLRNELKTSSFFFPAREMGARENLPMFMWKREMG